MFESPGIARLLVQLPIGLGDRCRPHQSIGIKIIERFLAFALADAFADPSGIDAGIDDEMGDMDVLGAEFPSGRPQAEFCAGKGDIAAAAAQAGCGTREKYIAASMGQHQMGRLAPG